MKHYNVEGYVRHKHDLEEVTHRNEEGIYYDEQGNIDYTQMKKDTIIIMWMPLCEHLARKFATSQQASGVMDITDLKWLQCFLIQYFLVLMLNQMKI